MAKLDNPAGRLHELLVAYREHASDQAAIVDIWASVFAVERRTEALLRIAETAGLVPEIEAAVNRSGDEAQITLFRRQSATWVAAVVNPEHNLYATPSNAKARAVDLDTLAVLGGLSSYLSATASEGPVPEWEVVNDLRDQVRELINEIIKDEELPDEVKRAALDHAHRLEQALDHFRVGGPGAVKAATERLIGGLAMSPESVRQHGIWERIVTVAGMAWQVFTKGQQAQQALTAWQEVVKALPGGS